MKKIKALALFVVLLVLVTTFFACTPEGGNGGGSVDKDTSTNITQMDESTLFSDRDKSGNYDESGAVFVTLSSNGIVCNGGGATVQKNVLKITGDGVYVITGSAKCQIVVDAPQTAKIQIVLKGAEICCETSAAIYVKQAGKVFLTIADGTENVLSNKYDFVAVDNNNVDAVVFSKDDLTVNGNGKLTVNAVYGHGIVSKDDLVTAGCTLHVTAKRSCLNANNSIRIAGGTYVLNAGTDGVHCAHDTDTSLGFVYVSDGVFTVDAQSDCFETTSQLQIANGTFNLKSDVMGFFTKGNLLIKNGTFDISSVSDGIHSKENICLEGGNISCSSADDGIHADGNLTIRGGAVNITNSYEGLEALSIDILGGEISIIASDDGVNAAGGKDQSGFGGTNGRPPRPDEFQVTENCYIKISGGVLRVNAIGDGLDSNGNLFVTGGECYVCGPVSNGNGALDYNGDAQITGGIVVAVGSSGMAQNFGSNSTQCSILTTFTRSTAEIVLKDKDGNVLLTFAPSKAYTSVVVSCPQIAVGNTYTLCSGGQSQTIKMTSIIYGNGSGMAGPGMGGRP